MTKDDPWAYVYISEQTSPDDNTIRSLDVRKAGGTDVVHFDTCLHSFDVMNRNQRQYLGDNILENIQTEEIQTMIKGKRWFGEQDHPMNIFERDKLTPERVRKIYMPNRSHVILSPRKEGNLLCSEIESSCNDVGQGFRDETLRGMIPAFSCRAVARMDEVNGKPTVIVRRLITYDWVLFQSHREAEAISGPKVRHVDAPVMESAGSIIGNGDKRIDVVIPLVDILKNISNTDPNVNCIMESFDLKEDNLVGYDTKEKRVIIGDRENRIFSRLTPESIKKVENALSLF